MLKDIRDITIQGANFEALTQLPLFCERTDTAKAVILAVGASNRHMGIAREEELLGKGISYCATCDGFLYKGKTVAVYCTDERMEHDIKYLEEIAEKLYVYTSFGYTSDAENVEILQRPVKKLDGGMKVESMELTDGTKIDIDGIFILRPAIAPSTLFSGLERITNMIEERTLIIFTHTWKRFPGINKHNIIFFCDFV